MYEYQLPSPFPEDKPAKVAFFADLDNSERGLVTINQLSSRV